MTIMEEIRHFLEQQKYLDNGQYFDEKASLTENGVIDSIGMMKLVGFLEDRYGIVIEDDDLMPENFDCLRAITDYVNALRPK